MAKTVEPKPVSVERQGSDAQQSAPQPPLPDGHWAGIGESTTVIGIKLLILAYRFGGKPLFKVLLAPVIAGYFLIDKRARRSTQRYLGQINLFNAAMPGPSWANSLRMFWEFGLVLIDKFAVWMGHIRREDVEVHNKQMLEYHMADTRGAVFLLSHLGNFEICRALSQTRVDMKLTVLVHTLHAEKFNALLRQFGDHQSIDLMQVTSFDVSSSIMLSERLSRGEFIAIAGDRVPLSSGATVDIDFLGKTAAFPSGPFLLAAVLGAPIIMLTCFKVKGRYQLHFDKMSDGGRKPRKERRAQIESLMHHYVDNLQGYVQQAPLQWFNFFDFWKAGKAVNETKTGGSP